MWKTNGFPLAIDNISGDQLYLGWKEILVSREDVLSSLRTGKILSKVPFKDCSLSRDHCAIVHDGKCQIIGLYDTFECQIEHIRNVQQISMMANNKLALRSSDEVFVYDFARGTTKSWKICCSSIATGFDHLIALSENGKVYSYGDASRGQLGSGELEASQELIPVEHLEDLDILTIAAGGWHSAVLSDRGYLYQWGWNQHGQIAGLENDTKNIVAAPMLRDVGKRVEQVQCGSRHTIVLTEDGKLLSWGWDDFGQCSKLKVCCENSSKNRVLRAGFWTSVLKTCGTCKPGESH